MRKEKIDDRTPDLMFQILTAYDFRVMKPKALGRSISKIHIMALDFDTQMPLAGFTTWPGSHGKIKILDANEEVVEVLDQNYPGILHSLSAVIGLIDHCMERDYVWVPPSEDPENPAYIHVHLRRTPYDDPETHQKKCAEGGFIVRAN